MESRKQVNICWQQATFLVKCAERDQKQQPQFKKKTKTNNLKTTKNQKRTNKQRTEKHTLIQNSRRPFFYLVRNVTWLRQQRKNELAEITSTFSTFMFGMGTIKSPHASEQAYHNKCKPQTYFVHLLVIWGK